MFLCTSSSINCSSFASLIFPRDQENKTHIVKLKSGGSNGRLPHPKNDKKKKNKKSGISPEEAFDRKYFPKTKHKPSHGVSLFLHNSFSDHKLCDSTTLLRICQVFSIPFQSCLRNTSVRKISHITCIISTENQDYAADVDDFDEDASHEMLIFIEDTQIAGGHAYLGL